MKPAKRYIIINLQLCGDDEIKRQHCVTAGNCYDELYSVLFSNPFVSVHRSTYNYKIHYQALFFIVDDLYSSKKRG